MGSWIFPWSAALATALSILLLAFLPGEAYKKRKLLKIARSILLLAFLKGETYTKTEER